MADVDEEDVETALKVLEEIERAEGDTAHKNDVADVRRMLVGVFDREKFLREFGDDERIGTLVDVLEAVDPDDQHWTDDTEEVEELKRVGLDYAEIYDR